MILRFPRPAIGLQAFAALVAGAAACSAAAAQTDCVLSDAMPADYAALVQPALHEPARMWPEATLTASGAPVNIRPTVASHGQLLLGHETYFLYHLPGFMNDPNAHPHNFQVILEVAFAEQNARDALVADQVDAGDEDYYTAVPPPFAQTALFLDYPGHPPLRAFDAVDVFRDHFERDGVEILTAPMTIEAMVHGREFAPDLPRPDALVYLLFGRGSDWFLAHMLSAPPDFDQILSVEVGPDLPETQGTALYVTLPGRANDVTDRLGPGEVLACSGLGGGLRVVAEPYCETGELSRLNFGPQQDCPSG